MKKTLLVLLNGLFTVLAAPQSKWAGYAIKDQHPVPPQWRAVERAPADHSITLRIGLAQESFKELERRLYEVSDPDHDRYGQYLSQDEAHQLTAPTEHCLKAVHDWLESSSVQPDQIEYSPSKDWLAISLPISEVETLLDTDYHVWENQDGHRLIRTPRYSLPRSLHQHIDVIQPTNYFGRPKALRRNLQSFSQPASTGVPHRSADYNSDLSAAGDGDISAVCDPSAVTSLCLRTLYGTVDYQPQMPQQNHMAITAFEDETANYSDFHLFMSRFRRDALPDYEFNYAILADAVYHQDPETEFFGLRDLEANLDIQTIAGQAYPTRLTAYAIGGLPPYTPDTATTSNTNEPYLTWTQHMLSLPQNELPKTISTSYGDDEQSVPYAYAERVCKDIAQLGARGTTVLFASGDVGVGPNGTCYANDGTHQARFLPEFPASCPYVTVVGGTRGFAPEAVAWDARNGYVSGAGVSNYFKRPEFQEDVVQGYLEGLDGLHAGLYNENGRAYPDIAAQGFGYVVVYAGMNILLDGTSAAAPTAAGVLTLVNDALLAAGKPTLGFMNPWLYKYGHKSFTDVTNGSTWGCDTSGFPATEGFDLASGFGTPNFKKIVAELAVG